MQTLLIDDEKLAISRLERLLGQYAGEIEIIGSANNGLEGLAMIEQRKPDLIFLDIEMPVLTGFELLAKLSYMPLVVFATAFEAYAIRAFEENSVDYLLKPIEPERLARTIQKLKDRTTKNQENPVSTQLLEMIAQLKPKKELTSISVKLGDRILLIRIDDITHFEAEDKYVYLYTQEGKKHLLDYSLTTLEEKLPAQFVRVSRSAIINQLHIQEIQKYFNGKYVIILHDKTHTKITTGSSFADKVKKLFEL
jgi:two-component system LytT family response regulator